MPRLNEKQYSRRATLAAAIHIAAMLIVWPLGRTAVGLPMKALLALPPLFEGTSRIRAKKRAFEVSGKAAGVATCPNH